MLIRNANMYVIVIRTKKNKLLLNALSLIQQQQISVLTECHDVLFNIHRGYIICYY